MNVIISIVPRSNMLSDLVHFDPTVSPPHHSPFSHPAFPPFFWCCQGQAPITYKFCRSLKAHLLPTPSSRNCGRIDTMRFGVRRTLVWISTTSLTFLCNLWRSIPIFFVLNWQNNFSSKSYSCIRIQHTVGHSVDTYWNASFHFPSLFWEDLRAGQWKLLPWLQVIKECILNCREFQSNNVND